MAKKKKKTIKITIPDFDLTKIIVLMDIMCFGIYLSFPSTRDILVMIITPLTAFILYMNFRKNSFV